MMFLPKDVRKKIKDVAKEIMWEEKKKKELVEKNLDYDFLQTLINKCDANPDLRITIYLKNNQKIVIQTKKNSKMYSTDAYDYDGEPAINEMEIK
jgi:hypothetical protein